MLQTDEKGIYSIPAEQSRREDGKMRPKELEGNKTYTVLTAVLGEQFWELAQKLGSLSEEKKRELWETGYLEVELSGQRWSSQSRKSSRFNRSSNQVGRER